MQSLEAVFNNIFFWVPGCCPFCLKYFPPFFRDSKWKNFHLSSRIFFVKDFEEKYNIRIFISCGYTFMLQSLLGSIFFFNINFGERIKAPKILSQFYLFFLLWRETLFSTFFFPKKPPQFGFVFPSQKILFFPMNAGLGASWKSQTMRWSLFPWPISRIWPILGSKSSHLSVVPGAISWTLVKQQDDRTSEAVISFFQHNELFHRLSRNEVCCFVWVVSGYMCCF